MHTFLFIGGLHRSGTTLLADILSQHPDIATFRDADVHEDEGQFLQSVYPTDNAYGGPGRFAFDKRAHLTEESPLLTNQNKKRLMEEWSRYWDLSKPILVEKTPANIIHSRFLQAIFPNSHFIFIMRHPVATSIATHKWSGTGIYSLINHWVTCHEIIEGDMPHLKHSITITFERLILQPEEVLKELESFIGIAKHSHDFSIDPTRNQKYFELWWNLFLPNRNRAKPIPKLGAVHAHKQRGFRNINLKRLIKSHIKKYIFGEERQMSHTVFEAQDAVEMFEDRVTGFGYSLLDLEKLPRSTT